MELKCTKEKDKLKTNELEKCNLEKGELSDELSTQCKNQSKTTSD
jgi:hypothetical protein